MALIGGLMFMGFAGTAAAQDVSIDASQETGDATNNAEVSQENNNAQVGISGAFAAGDAADNNDHKKDYYNDDNNDGDGVSATASVDQTQDVAQGNEANVDQTAETGDAAVGDITIDLGEEPVDDNDDNNNEE